MSKVIWTERSLERIEEICDFIALDSQANANKFAQEIFSKEQILLSNPKIGKVVPEYKLEEFRQIIIGNYRLVYQIIGKQIYVLTVRNCKQSQLFDDN